MSMMVLYDYRGKAVLMLVLFHIQRMDCVDFGIV